ncbi:MAG: hypothetical protein KKF62_17950 [Bacteroidetes bacterium]|nr:hypothetical protein [Bacteroidota bacterium]MBU1115314.1 hypothetical protein [Bacteroidota bacterium]MBU1800366.1 hypothetical protein [Bacteroidota bacterium]
MAMNNFYLLQITIFFFANLLSAQIHVDANGNTAIGADNTTFDKIHKTKLKITSDGMTGDTWKYKVYSYDYRCQVKTILINE